MSVPVTSQVHFVVAEFPRVRGNIGLSASVNEPFATPQLQCTLPNTFGRGELLEFNLQYATHVISPPLPGLHALQTKDETQCILRALTSASVRSLLQLCALWRRLGSRGHQPVRRILHEYRLCRPLRHVQQAVRAQLQGPGQ